MGTSLVMGLLAAFGNTNSPAAPNAVQLSVANSVLSGVLVLGIVANPYNGRLGMANYAPTNIVLFAASILPYFDMVEVPVDAPLLGKRNGSGVAQSLPCQVLLIILSFPVIGLVLIGFSVSSYGYKYLKISRGDHNIVMVCGILLQLAMVTPLILLIQFRDSYHSLVEKLESRADFFGPLIIYPIVVVFYVIISVVFVVFAGQTQDQSSRYRRDIRHDDSHSEVPTIIEELRRSCEFRLDYVLIPFAMALGAGQTLVLRVCSWTGSTTCTVDGKVFSFSNSLFSGDVYFWYVTGFWWVLWSLLLLTTIFAAMLYYQQLRQLEEFIYVERTRNLRLRFGRRR